MSPHINLLPVSEFSNNLGRTVFYSICLLATLKNKDKNGQMKTLLSVNSFWCHKGQWHLLKMTDKSFSKVLIPPPGIIIALKWVFFPLKQHKVWKKNPQFQQNWKWAFWFPVYLRHKSTNGFQRFILMAPLITVQQRSQIVNDFKWASQTPKKCQTMKSVSARQYLSNTTGNHVPSIASPPPPYIRSLTTPVFFCSSHQPSVASQIENGVRHRFLFVTL